MSRHRKIHGLEGDDYDVSCIAESTNESFKLDHTGVTESSLNCELCADLKFSCLEELCNHRRMVHGLFPCDLCNKCYGRTSHLWKHVNRVHKGHVDITCPYCMKTSASKDHLAAHIAKIHRYEPEVRRESKNCIDSKSPPVEDGVLHHCEKCNKGFHKRYLLRRHMKGCQNYRKDPGALLTRCRACERIFKDRASLQKHIENHHSTYTCHLCSETITSKLGIMTHNRVKHMDHPDLTCEYSSCKKLFRTKEDLESHRKDHKYHGTPNVCDFCGDTVENKLKLKMHVLSLHRNEIGVSCGVCLIPMKDPKDLKKHVEDVHRSVLSKPNTCQVCGKQYASKWKAFDHTKKCHGKVFRTCKQCLAVFTSDTDIRHHYEHVHNVPKDQLIAFEYRMDMRTKNDEYDAPDVVVKEEPDDLEFDEEICDEDSNDSKRRRSLTDTYDCEMCPEIFLNYDTLSKHYQNVHNTDPVRMFKKRKQDTGGKRKMRNRKNFECKNCKKQFSTKTLFWNHINACSRRNFLNRLDTQPIIPTSILETHLKNNNQIDKDQAAPLVSESNLNIPDFNLFEDINMQLSNQKPVPNLMPLLQIKATPAKCPRKDSRKVYDESTNTVCACEVCGKQWPAKKHLWQHLIRFHRAEAAVTCGVCLKLCKTYEDLADHLKAFHAAILSSEGNNFTCKTCGRYHNARSKLLLHMSIHIDYSGSFWCPKCQQNFTNEGKLTDHIASCRVKTEFEEEQNEENVIKNEIDEKGSLIGDEMSIEEVEEVDFESEAEADAGTHEDSNCEHSENSEDSDSANNTSSSDEEEDEEENESGSESRSNSRGTAEVSCNSESENSDSENLEEDGESKNMNIDPFRIHNEEYSDKQKMDVEIDEIAQNDAKSHQDTSEDIEKEDLRGKGSSGSQKSDVDFTDDEGPPILSPIMPLLLENESEEQNSIDHMSHKLSPMVPLCMDSVRDEDMCELSDRDNALMISNSTPFYKDAIDGKNIQINVSAVQSLDLESEDFENNRINEANDSSEEEETKMDDDCNSVDRFQKLEDADNLDVFEESSFEDNLNEEEEEDAPEYKDDAQEDVQMHDLSGTVLMLANDSEGNQILIHQNVLDIRNEDSNTEGTEYIYEEGNEYGIEEYGIARDETDSALQAEEMPDVPCTRNLSEREDEDSEEEEEEEQEEEQCAKKNDSRT